MKRLFAALLSLALVACDSADAPAPAPETTPAPADTIVVTDWQQSQREAFEQAAAQWQQALLALEQKPQQAQLDALRQSLQAWYKTFTDQALLLNARACQLNQFAILERMDTWPLYPGYIDAMPQWPESGLISDPYLELDRKTLRTQHGATDSAEASLGFAAMFVVLNGTGDAPKALPQFTSDEHNASRRLSYLKLAGEQLLADYQTLGTEIPLASRNLDCALARLLEQHQQLAELTDSDGELVVPQAVSQTLNDGPPTALQSIPEPVITAWEEARPGILDAINASQKDGWSAIAGWLDAANPATTASEQG